MEANYDPIPINNPSENPSGDMEPPVNPQKKKAKFDCKSVKNILDETAVEILNSKGYAEKNKEGPMAKLRKGICFLALALHSPFVIQTILGTKLNLIALCIFWSLQAGRKLSAYYKVKNVFSFTHPLTGSRDSTGLSLSSKLEKSNDMYTLIIDSEDLEFSRPPVHLTRSFYDWFGSDGVLMEGLFRKDVEGLLYEYVEEFQEIDGSRYWWNAAVEMIVTLSLIGLCMMIYLPGSTCP